MAVIEEFDQRISPRRLRQRRRRLTSRSRSEINAEILGLEAQDRKINERNRQLFTVSNQLRLNIEASEKKLRIWKRNKTSIDSQRRVLTKRKIEIRKRISLLRRKL